MIRSPPVVGSQRVDWGPLGAVPIVLTKVHRKDYSSLKIPLFVTLTSLQSGKAVKGMMLSGLISREVLGRHVTPVVGGQQVELTEYPPLTHHQVGATNPYRSHEDSSGSVAMELGFYTLYQSSSNASVCTATVSPGSIRKRLLVGSYAASIHLRQ